MGKKEGFFAFGGKSCEVQKGLEFLCIQSAAFCQGCSRWNVVCVQAVQEDYRVGDIGVVCQDSPNCAIACAERSKVYFGVCCGNSDRCLCITERHHSFERGGSVLIGPWWSRSKSPVAMPEVTGDDWHHDANGVRNLLAESHNTDFRKDEIGEQQTDEQCLSHRQQIHQSEPQGFHADRFSAGSEDPVTI